MVCQTSRRERPLSLREVGAATPSFGSLRSISMDLRRLLGTVEGMQPCARWSQAAPATTLFELLSVRRLSRYVASEGGHERCTFWRRSHAPVDEDLSCADRSTVQLAVVVLVGLQSPTAKINARKHALRS